MIDQVTDPEAIQNALKENIISEERESFNALFDEPEKWPSSLQKEKQSHVVKEEDDFDHIDMSDLKGTKQSQDVEDETKGEKQVQEDIAGLESPA